jgi:membrane protein YdbS with pleckstrin-like domain
MNTIVDIVAKLIAGESSDTRIVKFLLILLFIMLLLVAIGIGILWYMSHSATQWPRSQVLG